MNTFRSLFYLVALLLITECSTTKKAAVPMTCDTYGTIIDMAGLDGCNWMIVSANGQKLLPQNWPPHFKKKDNLSIRFHGVVTEGASVCMAEDKIIKLDCIEINTEKPVKPKCHETADPMSVKWMQIHIAKFNVEKVEKYDYLDKYAYLFKGRSLNNVLFTCQGMELCNYREVEQSECSAKVVNLGKATTIWEKTK